MPGTPYLRALLFGSVIPCLVFGLMFSAVIFSGQQWLPLIVLIVGMYSMPPALVVTLLVSLWLMRAHHWWVQLITGLVLCGWCVIMTLLVLQYKS